MASAHSYDAIFRVTEILQKHIEMVDRAWTYFMIVSLVVLAVSYGSEKVRLTAALRRVIATGYVVFAAGNAVALVTAQQRAFHWMIWFNAELAKVDVPLRPLHPFPVWQLVLLHVLITAFVTLAILLSGRIQVGHRTSARRKDD
jgi:hypothetical protein